MRHVLSNRSAFGSAHRPSDAIHLRHSQPVVAASGEAQRGHP